MRLASAMHSAEQLRGATIEPVIQVQGLSKRYGHVTAVNGISFEVQPGEIFGLIGPDGAGKTTTFHILAGVMQATEGTVQILGRSPRQMRLRTGYLTQQFSLYLDLSIDENLRYMAGLRNVNPDHFAQRRVKYLRLMELERFSDRLAGQLSGGMKQKLALCCALIAQPDVLLLDEPTTGVDPVSRREFWDVLAALSQEGVTMVVATPYLDEAERCHRVALMYDGQIQKMGTPAELRSGLGLARLEVRATDLKACETILWNAVRQGEQTIEDVQTFGDRLDVLVPKAESNAEAIVAQVSHLLTKAQQSAEIQVSEPTLENVFVTRLRQQGSDPPFIPFPRPSQPHRSASLFQPEAPMAIGVTNLHKIFGTFHAVNGVNLQVRYGEIYGLLGANGAGKTTTIKMLCGLLAPTQGTVTLAGQTGQLRRQELRQRLGYMSQKFTLYNDLTIQENLEFYCGVYGVPRSLQRDRIQWVLEICGLLGRETLLTKKLPGGWKQRVAFGASVLHEPEILFLDEPTSGVDPLARRQFWRFIEAFARAGTAVLVTTHYLEEAEHCHRIGFMVAGEMVAQGSPSQIKAEQPGQLIELQVSDAQRAADGLKQVLEPWRVSLFGDCLHVVFNDADFDLANVLSWLQSINITVLSWRTIPFSLEDAFISIVQRAKKKRG
ncbi:ATP-binding cassette domain-containing protein [Fischerella sp. NIES-3754]|uniref:ATP-binding cassette domain-containing protein n=1 Tax=Fischerella sp. NIES-3754 TaxID=1752063 RepID=UPI0007206BF5|nr:ATP-binding cassette domain-containing protein [Fischerella sp. NIES-3754]BAU05756.1 ABC transporter related [Fischerella sp. NIES-3754]BCX08029.1 MAG: ABC transporter ATP-binding protein [Fischerella sp.]